MMFLILMLIIAVAAFNLVSTLMMVVNEKEADIAILRTYGATPGMIMGIFMVQGVDWCVWYLVRDWWAELRWHGMSPTL